MPVQNGRFEQSRLPPHMTEHSRLFLLSKHTASKTDTLKHTQLACVLTHYLIAYTQPTVRERENPDLLYQEYMDRGTDLRERPG